MLFPGHAQVEDLPDTDVLRAMVALQEGAVMEGDQHIVRGINRALNKCACPAAALANYL